MPHSHRRSVSIALIIVMAAILLWPAGLPGSAPLRLECRWLGLRVWYTTFTSLRLASRAPAGPAMVPAAEPVVARAASDIAPLRL